MNLLETFNAKNIYIARHISETIFYSQSKQLNQIILNNKIKIEVKS